MINIIKYEDKYLQGYKETIKILWDDIEDREILEIIDEHKNKEHKIFLAVNKEEVVGFLNTSIRNDYVEGSDSSRTGYIEGIFVKKAFRKQEIGVKLLNESYKYFKSINITEVGSDAFIDNVVSDNFHKAVGFKEVSINRHYLKKL